MIWDFLYYYYYYYYYFVPSQSERKATNGAKPKIIPKKNPPSMTLKKRFNTVLKTLQIKGSNKW
jgi:hypothetical protein